MTAVPVSVRVRWVRPGDESLRDLHKVRAWLLTRLASWRRIRMAAAYGWPGAVAVEWYPMYVDSLGHDDMVRVGSDAMTHIEPEYRSATGGRWAVDVWNGYCLTTFTPRMHW